MPTRYDWNLTLPEDVVELKEKQAIGVTGDIILVGRGSLAADGTLKPGEPALLIRILACAGKPVPELGLRDKANLLTIHTVAAAPDFKIMLHAFRASDPLPKTVWKSEHTAISVEFPDQKDLISFAPSASGRTYVAVKRGDNVLVKISTPEKPLGDAESDALTERLKRIPDRLARLRGQGYDPAKQRGFVAGWCFDRVVSGGIPPLPGSTTSAVAVPLTDSRLVEGMNGHQAVAAGPGSLAGTLDFAKEAKGQPFTVACWIKTKPNPWMGGLVNVDGIVGSEFIQAGLRMNVMRALSDNWPSTMFPSWTHLAFTFDGRQVSAYRNGILISTARLAEGAKFGWGKKFSFGGKGPYGDAEVVAQSIYFYNTAFTAEAVNDLYLWGKFQAE